MIEFILIAAIIGADQLSKYAIRALLSEGESIRVLGSFFRLTYIRNDGAAFSSFSGQRTLLLVFTTAAIFVTLFFLWKERGKNRLFTASLILIAGGGIGNLIDRALFGEVTDMLDFSFFPPIFNVADIAVCVGAGLLLLYVLIGERYERK